MSKHAILSLSGLLVLVSNTAAAERLCVSVDDVTSDGKVEYRIYHDADGRPVRSTETRIGKDREPRTVTNEATYANGRIVKLTRRASRTTTQSYRYDARGFLAEMHLDTSGDGKPDEGATYVWRGKALPGARSADRPSASRSARLSPHFGYEPFAFHGLVEERYRKLWPGPSDFDWVKVYKTDEAGRITRKTTHLRGRTAADPATNVASYKRDRTGLLLELTQDPIDPLLGRETFAYTDGKLAVHTTFRKDEELLRAEYEHDPKGRVTQIRHFQDGKSSTQAWTYHCP